MNLKKAVKIQELYLKHSDQVDHYDLDDAIRLGVEAMNLIDNLRFDGSPYYPNLLPGETET